jgi:hypothetical protein
MSNPDRIRFEYYTKNYIVFYFDKLDACEVDCRDEFPQCAEVANPP